MLKRRAKVSEKTERADRDAQEQLEHPDMDAFDRFIEKLLTVSKEEIDKLAPAKRKRHPT